MPNQKESEKIKKKIAVSKKVELGRLFQIKHAKEIIKLWRDLKNKRSDIVDKLNLMELYNIPSQDVAERAVCNAIRGYDGHYQFIDFPAYKGLLSKNEMKRITEERHKVNGSFRGSELLKEGKGLYKQTKEEWTENSRKGGNTAYKQQKGLFSQTPEEWIRTRVKGGISSIKSKGFTPFSLEETIHIFNLSEKREYQRSSKINNQKIAEEINKKFHREKKVRTPGSIANHRCKYKTIDNYLKIH